MKKFLPKVLAKTALFSMVAVPTLSILLTTYAAHEEHMERKDSKKEGGIIKDGIHNT